MAIEWRSDQIASIQSTVSNEIRESEPRSLGLRGKVPDEKYVNKVQALAVDFSTMSQVAMGRAATSSSADDSKLIEQYAHTLGSHSVLIGELTGRLQQLNKSQKPVDDGLEKSCTMNSRKPTMPQSFLRACWNETSRASDRMPAS